MKKTAPEPIRIVLAGIGGYGIHYVKTLVQRELQGAPLKLVALVDPAAKASPVYPQVSSLPCFQDLDACLRVHPADLVIVSSPIQFHAEQIRTALAHRAHVLCEKPLCATRQQGLDLIEAQAAAGLQVGIGYQWSFSPAILEALMDVRAGLYGVPQVFRTRVYWPRSDAYFGRNRWAGRVRDSQGRPVYDSVLNNATAHYLHNMLYFLGEKPHEARLPERIEARLLRCNPIETFDTALVRMEADLPDAPPVVLALAVSHTTAALVDPELEYRYSRGRLIVRDGVLRGEREGAGELAKDYGPITGPDPVADKLDAMLDAVRTGRRPPCDIRTAYAQTAVLATIHERARLENVPEAAKIKTRRDEANWLSVPGLEAVMDRFVRTLALPDTLGFDLAEDNRLL
ncbi:MAG: Gfo/Idh/MocA family oxidoreductase [Eubacteriales bacterium]|nr:Gfo/Idh/MocA family oxidoreductase [Eubacteriales bacterium]